MAFDWKRSLAAALTGAGTGAVAGAPFGGVGAGFGAAGGAAVGFLTDLLSNLGGSQTSNGAVPEGAPQGNALTGQSAFVQRFNNLPPEEQQVVKTLLPQILEQLKQNPDIEPILEGARQDFYGKTVPKITEQFAAGDERASGPLQAALASAGGRLNLDLAGLRSQYQLERQGQLQNMLSNLLNPGFYSNAYFPGTPGAVEQLAPSLADLGKTLAENFASQRKKAVEEAEKKKETPNQLGGAGVVSGVTRPGAAGRTAGVNPIESSGYYPIPAFKRTPAGTVANTAVQQPAPLANPTAAPSMFANLASLQNKPALPANLLQGQNRNWLQQQLANLK